MRPKALLASYSFCFVSFGATCTLIGPTVGLLAKNLGRDPDELGVLYIFGSGAELLGGLVSGLAYDWAPKGNVVILCAAAVLAVLFSLIPPASFTSLIVLTCTFTAACLPRPFINTGGNLMVVWILGKKSAPWLNAINGMFGLGATLAPAVAHFGVSVGRMLGLPEGWAVGPAFWFIGSLCALSCIFPTFLESPRTDTAQKLEEDERQRKADERRVARQQSQPLLEEGDVEGGGADADGESEGEEVDEDPEPDVHARNFEPILVLGVVFMTAATAIEVSLGNWVFTYGAEVMGLDENLCGTINSFYWASFTAGRLFILPLLFAYTSLKPSDCLVGSTVIVILGCWAQLHFMNVVTIFICTAAGGIGVAPCYGTTVALVREHIPLSGRAQSSFAIATGLGAGIGPFLAAQSMQRLGYYYLIPYELAMAVIALVACIAMALWPKQRSLQEWEDRKYEREYPAHLLTISEFNPTFKYPNLLSFFKNSISDPIT